ncbi:MAG TPA: hypothetical protein VEI07_19670 [Planctomycetaceae bacterium]|nr:hypothetical protein [Planctomycetaceae bacterium]
MKRTLIHRLILAIVLASLPAVAFGEQKPEGDRLSDLEGRVSGLEWSVHQTTGDGAALFLFGAFCALWAQNTGRSAWLWFFLGVLFNVITVLVLLAKNSDDRARRAEVGTAPPGNEVAR